MNLLLGNITPDLGVVQRSSHLTIGFLPQEIVLDHLELSAREYIEKGPLSALEQQMAACLDNPDRLAEWAELHEEYERLGGYKKTPLEKVFRGLKLEKCLLDMPMATLSSGQKIRVALAKALIEDPDLLLLDEPTNHLDQEMLIWLEEMLQLRRGATVIVSHDRKFLNKSCNRLVEIKDGKLTCYGGNYDFYLQEQERLIERQMKAYEAQEEERSQLKQKIKAITFSKGKAPPPTDRNIIAYDSQGEHHQKSVQRNLNALKTRLEEIEANLLAHPKPKTIKGIRFLPTPLVSTIAIEFDQVSKGFDGKILFSKFNQVLCKGDRVILTGPNGSGKTTLLRCVVGLLNVDSGTIRYAPTVKIGYLDQEVNLLPMDKTPFQYFESRFGLSEEDLRRELHKAALGGAELLNRLFASLSVGQRKRLMLLSLIFEKPNVLILDEPTNHLDFLTLEAFEKALLNFEGAILAVSHDTTFIEKISTQEWSLAIL